MLKNIFGGGISKSSDTDSTATASSSSLKNQRKVNSSSINSTQSTLKKMSASFSHRGQRQMITYNQNFLKVWDVGDQVMPSTHRGQEVRFGRRRRDKLNVVIKIREKMVSFKDEEDVGSWSANMEIIMNLPPEFCENVAKLIAVEEDDRNYYIIMEKVNGKDLFEFSHSRPIHFHERMDKMQIIQKITKETFTALAAYEKHNLTHRDLKLENIVMHIPQEWSEDEIRKRRRDGDFGICKVVDFDTCELYDPHNQTIAHDVMGTDQYIAPEAYAGIYTPASDVFACGVMIYKLTTGCFPFLDEIFDDEPGQNFVGHPKMRDIRTKLKMAKVDMSHTLLREYPAVKDLIKRCLLFDERRRVRASQALEHPFIADDLFLHSRAGRQSRRESAASSHNGDRDGTTVASARDIPSGNKHDEMNSAKALDSVRSAAGGHGSKARAGVQAEQLVKKGGNKYYSEGTHRTLSPSTGGSSSGASLNRRHEESSSSNANANEGLKTGPKTRW